MRRYYTLRIGFILAVVFVGLLHATADTQEQNITSVNIAGTYNILSEVNKQGCSWLWPASIDVNNVAFIDSNAYYWMYGYILEEGEKILVKGTYPNARYMSLTTYGLDGVNVADSLYDTEITADPGNPLRYTVTIDPETKHHSKNNTLAAFPVDSNYNAGILTYRLYLQDDPRLPKGLPLPTIVLVREDGSQEVFPECPPKAMSVMRGCDPFPEGPLRFYRIAGGNNFPNPQNAYVGFVASYEPGRILVIEGKVPTFPDTRKGEDITKSSQLRYWSFNVYQNKFPMPLISGMADFETILDTSGNFTFVISVPADRPANALPENGVNWLSWNGSEDITDIAVIYRNMLPAEDFVHAANNIQIMDDPDEAARVMGEYYPSVTSMTKEEFEAKYPS